MAALVAGLALLSSAQAAYSSTCQMGSTTYTNKGLVGFGAITATAIDSYTDTIGGIGSSAYIQSNSFKKNSDGTYSGIIAAGPDRGHNTQTTVDYHGRHQLIDFTLNPYTGNLTYGAQASLGLTYVKTLEYIDPFASNKLTTGLDPTGIRPATGNFPRVPIAGSTNSISLDQEGMALMKDGVSDEYGPYIYHVSAKGEFLSAIQPPQAVLPYNAAGQLNFTSLVDPKTGRGANQGFEGLTISPDNKYLYALLQSSCVQDNNGSSKGRFTRLFQWSIAGKGVPKLTGEWVVQLPTSADLSTVYAASELHYVSPNLFMVLARDGKGAGNGDAPPKNSQITSAFKTIGFVSTLGVTNIANTKYDQPTNPIAVNNTLVSGVNAAQFVTFVSLIDPSQLSKAGLQNGPPLATDIVGKFESIALASALDKQNPDDYFLFTLADNDFIALNGSTNGVPYSDPYAVATGLNNPNQFMVYRVTLPNAKLPSYIYAH